MADGNDKALRDFPDPADFKECDRSVGTRFLAAADAAGISKARLKREVLLATDRTMQRHFGDEKDDLGRPNKIPHYIVREVAQATGISADYLLGLIPDPLPLDRAMPSPAPGDRRALTGGDSWVPDQPGGELGPPSPRRRATDAPSDRD